MSLSKEVITAIIIGSINLFISFNLSLPAKSKKNIQLYTIMISLLFILFIRNIKQVYSFSLFVSVPELNLTLFSLSLFYFLLLIPLLVALGLHFRRLILQADIHVDYLRYGVIIGILISLAVIIYFGNSLFIVAFLRFTTETLKNAA